MTQNIDGLINWLIDFKKNYSNLDVGIYLNGQKYDLRSIIYDEDMSKIFLCNSSTE